MRRDQMGESRPSSPGTANRRSIVLSLLLALFTATFLLSCAAEPQRAGDSRKRGLAATSSGTSRAIIGAAAQDLVPALPHLSVPMESRLRARPPSGLDAYRTFPASFELNAGQTDAAVKFLARGRGYALFLTQDEAVLALTKGPGEAAVVRMSLVGARPPPRVTGLEKLPGIVNYFVGNDPASWRTSIPTYARVKYESVYPGVDLVYHGSQGELEYDFVVAPGADPRTIMLAFEGPDTMAVDSQGDLVLRTNGGELRLRRPVVYQEVDGTRKTLAGSYIFKAKNRVGFQVAAYDPAKPLVIDPVLVYSTYLGGTGTDQGRGIGLGPGGTAYVVGSTSAPIFPSADSSNLGPRGGSDVFVAKIDPSQPGPSSLVYLTFIGGRGTDTGRGIDVDGAGNAYLTGQTFSSDFPTTPSAFSRKISGKADAFVAKLNPSGTGLVYSTFLGGGGPDEGHAIAIACVSASEPTDCNAYVSGATLSSNFPITPFAVFASSQGKQDAFVTKLKADGSGLVYSTYLGGTGTDAGHGIALECASPPACSAWVTGETSSANFSTTVGAFDRVFNGNVDAFVTKLNADGSALLYSSYLGGSGFDRGFGIALDGLGRAYVAGSTDSTSFTGDYLTKTPSRLGPGGTGDAFVAKVDPSLPPASQLVYLTYVGGSGSDLAYAIDVDGFGNVSLTGETSSSDFPTVNPLPLALSGTTHAFVARLDASGLAFTYSTYLGGNGADRGFGVIANAGRVFVVGETSSTEFPTSGTVPPFDASFSGGPTDAFLTVLGGIPPVFGPVSNLMFQTGTVVTYPTPTALDAEGSPVLVGCDPASGSVAGATASPFQLGDTTVTCTATTNDGGTGTITFVVTVQTDPPPTLGLNVTDVTVRQGDPIVLTAAISASQSITTITPDCVNTTWTITRPDGLAVAPRFRERMYGIPNDLTTIAAGMPFIINCDISEVIDPSLLPPGQYRFFATYSNYLQDNDPTPPVFDVWTGSVNSPSAQLTVVGSVTRVQIDIKPTSFPSSFNCRNVDRTIDVAVLSGEVFDPADPTADPRPVFHPTSIDVSTVRFGKTGTEAAPTNVVTTDLNGDGIPDRVFDFIFGQTGFSCADTSGRNSADVVGILTGNTSGGPIPISGSDSIHLVGGP